MNDRSERVIEWPPERFYWAVLDPSILPRRLRRRREQLGYLLESFVPQPLEELQVVFAPLPRGRYLACAVDRSLLEAAIGPATVRLAPSSLPPFVQEALDPWSLNLLTGSLTPAPVRRLERRWTWLVAAAAVLATLVFTAGAERRARRAQRRAEGVVTSVDRRIQQVLGSASLRSPLPLDLQLEAELRSLRQTRAEEAPGNAFDAAGALAGLLDLWPDSVHVETDSIHVTSSAVHVQGRLGSNEEAQELATAVSNLPGWRSMPPTIRATSQGVQATIQLQREEKP